MQATIDKMRAAIPVFVRLTSLRIKSCGPLPSKRRSLGR